MSPAWLIALISAPTATAAWGCAFFRSASAVGPIGIVFDPDDGKDQESSHALARRAVHG
jgi:hypothetical protein